VEWVQPRAAVPAGMRGSRGSGCRSAGDGADPPFAVPPKGRGAPGAPPGPTYARRRPEETALYGVVHGHLESFLAGARDRDRIVPRFVERSFRSFLRCGVLAHGFLQVHCDACGHDRLVACSCKGRGVSPSCGGRRMADLTAHLVDHVFPEVPVRQWVLTLPFALRYWLAYDARLAAAIDRAAAAVFAWLRRRARKPARGKQPPGGSRRLRGGAVTFVHHADALNLNLHFHPLVLDGVYERYGLPGMGPHPFLDPGPTLANLN